MVFAGEYYNAIIIKIIGKYSGMSGITYIKIKITLKKPEK